VSDLSAASKLSAHDPAQQRLIREKLQVRCNDCCEWELGLICVSWVALSTQQACAGTCITILLRNCGCRKQKTSWVLNVPQLLSKEVAAAAANCTMVMGTLQMSLQLPQRRRLHNRHLLLSLPQRGIVEPVLEPEACPRSRWPHQHRRCYGWQRSTCATTPIGRSR
jgi:hypothetical protein